MIVANPATVYMYRLFSIFQHRRLQAGLGGRVQPANFLHQIGSLPVIALRQMAPSHHRHQGRHLRRTPTAGTCAVRATRAVLVVAAAILLAVAGDARVVLLLVAQHGVLQRKSPRADITGVGTFAGVRAHMSPQILG